jgi:hypothetical protein
MSDDTRSGHEAITCRQSTWLVSDSRERTLTAAEERALAEHIAGCRYCQGASRQFEVLFRQLGAWLERRP